MSKPFTPRQYQTEMAKFIVTHERCALFVPMGLGKTTSVLMALDALSLVDSGPILVVAPLRVARATWPDEIRKWDRFSQMTISVVCGTPAERSKALAKSADIHVTNYENLEWLTKYLGDAWPFTTVICDESSRLKGFRNMPTPKSKGLSRCLARPAPMVSKIYGGKRGFWTLV